MDQHITPSADISSAAHAFESLRAEISLLRRATERLTDERSAQPDYAPSLEAIAKRLEDVCVWARRVSERPALKLTPESIGRDIDAAAVHARRHDQELLHHAATRMDAATGRIDGMVARSRTVVEQNRESLWNRIAFAIAGMALWAILPGAVARSLPVSWAVPERIAARMLGTDMWHAGEDMMAKADRERRARIVAHQRERETASPSLK
ncbi:hypothetical protein EWE75_20705 [Sphingomonas populi]|uniref:Uncharacterized protein n=1 Tax=Sphingomonas populi TaxID=2484750 RepID=A0A4Q6XLW8_9SPHN|nr:DUF6118 family protein [Sphingomonas populi]RZF60881.1 hypothetical protein EWE75_20705 [Sphingomonas populi]